MCERCHEESDDDYEGGSIEEMRRKATRSIVKRHPELGLDPEDVLYRFVPKAQLRSLRIHPDPGPPRYEIHIPESMGAAMTGGPSLQAIAKAAWIESDRSYNDICEILGIRPTARYDAFFLSEEPPVNPVRSDQQVAVMDHQKAISEHWSDEE